MDSLILTSGRLFVARVVQGLKLQTVSVWQLVVSQSWNQRDRDGEVWNGRLGC